MSYFQYITKDDENVLGSKKAANLKVLSGNFKVNIAPDMPFNEKVTNYSNEELTYYLYQKGIMMRQIRTSA